MATPSALRATSAPIQTQFTPLDLAYFKIGQDFGYDFQMRTINAFSNIDEPSKLKYVEHLLKIGDEAERNNFLNRLETISNKPKLQRAVSTPVVPQATQTSAVAVSSRQYSELNISDIDKLDSKFPGTGARVYQIAQRFGFSDKGRSKLTRELLAFSTREEAEEYLTQVVTRESNIWCKKEAKTKGTGLYKTIQAMQNRPKPQAPDLSQYKPNPENLKDFSITPGDQIRVLRSAIEELARITPVAPKTAEQKPAEEKAVDAPSLYPTPHEPSDFHYEPAPLPHIKTYQEVAAEIDTALTESLMKRNWYLIGKKPDYKELKEKVSLLLPRIAEEVEGLNLFGSLLFLDSLHVRIRNLRDEGIITPETSKETQLLLKNGIYPVLLEKFLQEGSARVNQLAPITGTNEMATYAKMPGDWDKDKHGRTQRFIDLPEAVGGQVDPLGDYKTQYDQLVNLLMTYVGVQIAKTHPEMLKGAAKTINNFLIFQPEARYTFAGVDYTYAEVMKQVTTFLNIAKAK